MSEPERNPETGAFCPEVPLPEDTKSAIAGAAALDALVLGVQADARGSRRLHVPTSDLPSPEDTRAVLDALQVLAVPQASRWLPAAADLPRLPGTNEKYLLPHAESAARIALPAATPDALWKNMPEGDRRVFLASAEERRKEYASRLAAAGVVSAMIRREQTDEFSPEAIERKAVQRSRIGGISAVRRHHESRWINQNSPTRDLRPVEPPTVPMNPVRHTSPEGIDPPTLVTAAIPGGKEDSTGAGHVQGILIERPSKQE